MPCQTATGHKIMQQLPPGDQQDHRYRPWHRDIYTTVKDPRFDLTPRYRATWWPRM